MSDAKAEDRRVAAHVPDPAPADIICQNDDGSIIFVKAADDVKQIPTLEEVNDKNQNNANLRSSLRDQLDSQTRVFVIVSVLSGTQLAASFADELLIPLLAKLNINKDKLEIIYTKDANTVTTFSRKTLLCNANDGIPQLVILLSGDGGVVDVLNALLPRSAKYLAPEIALVPMGTGNALANSSGLTDPTFGLSALARGHPKALPLFKVRFSSGARLLVNEARDEEILSLDPEDGSPFLYGAVVCSWGMHAGLVADSDTAEYRKFGVERFKMAANEALYPADGSPPHHYKADVKIMLSGSAEWTTLQRTEHAYVLTTLVSNLEKGFTVSPASKPLDGSMRIVHFGPMGGDEIMGLMTKAYSGGKHTEELSVSYEQVDGVRIEFHNREDDGRWRRICVDGKIIRVERDGWVEIKRLDDTLLTLRTLEA